MTASVVASDSKFQPATNRIQMEKGSKTGGGPREFKTGEELVV